ncbi:MAG: KH domain-containing protein [Desulfobacteraceae bacterium]|nr:KH domain-containing protein [Desulfobacteraceae bacterium]
MALKDLAEFLIKSLADHPEKVELSEKEEDDTVLIELKISPDDLGKIIGKNGNTINAIRTVLQTAASSHKKRARLEVVGQEEIPEEDQNEE